LDTIAKGVPTVSEPVGLNRPAGAFGFEIILIGAGCHARALNVFSAIPLWVKLPEGYIEAD